MTVPKWCLVGVWVVVALVAAVESRAQTTTATLRGKVTDEQGAVLPGVAVTARQVDTNTSRSVVTGAVGQYFLPNLPAGRYEVSAELQGFRVERRWGWDCHGLPIENIVEKELGTKSKKEIEAMGVAKFNELCRSKVLGYVGEWEKTIRRLGLRSRIVTRRLVGIECAKMLARGM